MVLHIKGIVQGVGFRPFVYRLSRKFNLAGFVANDPRGVVVEIEGQRDNVRGFIKALLKNPPSVSRIESVEKKQTAPTGEAFFRIKKSGGGEKELVIPSHDLGLCNRCLDELFDETDRRFEYPLINCTQCGPRFTITEKTPYDRKNTTMRSFTMCPACAKEYSTAGSRRFHAQPNACYACGPGIALTRDLSRVTFARSRLATEAVLRQAVKHIYQGRLLAVKGVGGYHICANAKDRRAILRLRQKKHRPDKPFAVMTRDLRFIKTVCFIDAKERELLTSNRRPIVLLRIKKKLPWMKEIAPGQEYLGVMCAYAPLHYLLFKVAQDHDQSPVLVMTSANKKDAALIYTEHGLSSVKDVVDFFLIHNRPIHARCDDSIVRVVQTKEIMIRKTRGYTSDTFKLAAKQEILGCGAELKNMFAITKHGRVIVSPYIGDLNNSATYEAFTQTLSHYAKLFDFSPAVVAHDHHPGYLSTRYAHTVKGARLIAVQHHHAHLASCLLEHSLTEKVIGVCFDGTGFGLDGTAWGGEFLIANRRQFVRAAHFRHVGLIGADKAVQEPARIALFILNALQRGARAQTKFGCVAHFDAKTRAILTRLIAQGDYFKSSSAGRLFDAAASLLGLHHAIRHEAQAAIALEMLAMRHCGKSNAAYPFTITRKDSCLVIDWQPLFESLIEELIRGKEKAAIAYRFHTSLAAVIKTVACRLRQEQGINKAVLTGGVFQNSLLLKLAVRSLEKEDFAVYHHHRLPFNDGAIALGQTVVANENLK